MKGCPLMCLQHSEPASRLRLPKAYGAIQRGAREPISVRTETKIQNGASVTTHDECFRRIGPRITHIPNCNSSVTVSQRKTITVRRKRNTAQGRVCRRLNSLPCHSLC